MSLQKQQQQQQRAGEGPAPGLGTAGRSRPHHAQEASQPLPRIVRQNESPQRTQI